MGGYISLDSRCKHIINSLLDIQTNRSVAEIAKAMNVSKRSVYYDIERINDWLSYHKIDTLQVQRHSGISLSQQQRMRIREVFYDLDTKSFYVFSQEERVTIIICMILLADGNLYTDKLSAACEVSRNTVLNDMKLVNAELGKYNLRVLYGNKAGYYVKCKVIKKRAIFLYYLSTIINLVSQQVIGFIDYNKVAYYQSVLSEIETALNTEYVEGTLDQLAVLMAAVEKSNEKVEIENLDEQSVINRAEYNLVKAKLPMLEEQEQLYLTIHLLGARIQVCQGFIIHHHVDNELRKLVKDSITEFEQLACIRFEEKEALEEKLLTHLSISLFRYRYGIVEGNPLSKEIEIKYPSLFNISKKIAESLSHKLGYPISNSEVAYLTMHFGAHLINDSRKKGRIKVLLVCSNGISTAHLLKKEVEALSPIIEIERIISAKELETYTKPYDMIVSTVQLKDHPNAVIVKPLLTTIDKQALLSYVYRIEGINRNNGGIERVFKLVKKYVPDEQHARLYGELESYYSKQAVYQDALERENPRLRDILNPGRIILMEQADDWKHAIEAASAPLVRDGSISSDYTDAMISNVTEFGPYIFITPEIALAHAKPENGVNQMAISLLIMRKEVLFFEGYRAKIIIVLAPVDNESHLTALKDIVAFFSESGNLKKLLKAATRAEAYGIMAENDFSEY